MVLWSKSNRSTVTAVSAAISAVSFIISVFGYHKNGEIPVLGVSPPFQAPAVVAMKQNDNLCWMSCRPCNYSSNAMGTDNHDTLQPHTCVATKKALLMADYYDSENTAVCHKNRHFLNRTSPIVALVSFPGSGNSWTRHLLEQATGIYTGSIYCDTTLKAFFPGEYTVSGDVLAVKTHQSDSVNLPSHVQKQMGKKTFDKGILIVRDPYDALVSEANRRWSKVQKAERHLGLAMEKSFIGKYPAKLILLLLKIIAFFCR